MAAVVADEAIVRAALARHGGAVDRRRSTAGDNV